jgi:hypothetical protein
MVRLVLLLHARWCICLRTSVLAVGLFDKFTSVLLGQDRLVGRGSFLGQDRLGSSAACKRPCLLLGRPSYAVLLCDPSFCGLWCHASRQFRTVGGHHICLTRKQLSGWVLDPLARLCTGRWLSWAQPVTVLFAGSPRLVQCAYELHCDAVMAPACLGGVLCTSSLNSWCAPLFCPAGLLSA